MKRVEIFNDNYSALGFGDTLNKLSYLYRTYENEDVEFLFHSKRKVLDTIFLLKEFCFEEPEYKKIFINSENFLRSEKDFKLINHKYWPTKVKWSKKSDYVAINFYTNIRKIHELSATLDEDILIENHKLFLDCDKIRNKYSTVELYGIESERGHNKVLTEYDLCLEKNMKILSECNLFVTSEGGMAHLSRAMRVPTIIFFKKCDFRFYRFLEKFIDKKIQKLVNSTDEMIRSIDYYLSHDKFD